MKKKISIIVASCLCIGMLTVLTLLWKEKDDFNEHCSKEPTDLSVGGIATFYIDFVYIVEWFL